MTSPDFLIRAADLSLLIYLVLLAGVALWAFQGRVPALIKAKYVNRVIFMSQMPFAHRWRCVVSTEDLPLFERARVRQHVVLIVSSALTLLIMIHAYINTVAELWRCNIGRVGLLPGQ